MIHVRQSLLLGLFLLAAMTAFLLVATRPDAAHAAGITVTTSLDAEPANDGECTLREAIINANADDQSGSTDCAAGSGNDVITFTHPLAGPEVPIPAAYVAFMLPEITSTITIDGTTPDGPTYLPSTYRESRHFYIDTTGNLTLTGLALIGGSSTAEGGAIANHGTLTIQRSALTQNNAATQGGAIFSAGTLTITESTFAANNAAGAGGVIYATGPVDISASTLIGNTSAADGGAIFVNGAALTVANSTITLNTAINGTGTAIFNQGSATLVSTSIVDNGAAGAAVFNGSGGTLSATNVLISEGAGALGCGAAGDNFASFTGPANSNLSSDTSCPAPLFFEGDALLQPLALNSGLTENYLPGPESDAIDSGSSIDVPTVDQRGVVRPQMEGFDIGAVERRVDEPLPGELLVTTTSGALAPDSVCSLPEAVFMANGSIESYNFPECGTHNPDGLNTITFAESLGTATITLDGTFVMAVTGETLIDGAGVITIDANHQSKLFSVTVGADLTLNGLTMINGLVTHDGGGAIDSAGTLTITNSTLSGHASTEYYAGAVANESGTLTISNTTFSNNTSAIGGGAIINEGPATITDSTFAGNSALVGGAIYNTGMATSLTITGSTFSGNSVHDDFAAPNPIGSGGGAIFSNFASSLTISNSTFSGNSATVADPNTPETTGGLGGAIGTAGGTVTVTYSTFSGNSSNTGGGTIFNTSGTADLTGNIIADSTGGNCVGLAGEEPTVWQGGALSNLDDDGTCAALAETSFIEGDADLGALADNGGPTLTHLPGAESNAIDAVPAQVSCPASDQRGVSRPQASACDMGSVELAEAQLPEPESQVTTVIDAADYLEGCTLRDAIASVQSGEQVGTCQITGTITFADDLVGDEPENDRTITLNGTQLPTITATVSIDGATTVILDANELSRHFTVSATGNLTLSAITLENGNAANGNGGAIYNEGTLTITDSTLSNNDATSASALYNTAGTATITDSTFSNNTATENGTILTVGQGTTKVNNSTIMQNSAGVGGAFYVYNGTLNVANSTISGNTATAEGGAVYAADTSTVTITNSTIANSTTPSPGSAVHTDSESTVIALTGTIVANSSSANCSPPPGIWLGVTASNLSDDDSCSSVLFVQGEDGLAALADNGGPTLTHLPGDTSNAIDALPLDATCPATDQRGESRPFNATGTAEAHCDIGAVELQRVVAVLDVAITKEAPSTVRPGDAIPYTITLTNNGDPANVTFTDTLAAGSTLTGPIAIPDGWSCDGIGGASTLTCSTTTTDWASPAVFTFSGSTPLLAVPNSIFTNTVTGTASNAFESAPLSASDSTRIAPLVSLSFTKSVNRTRASQGETLTYTLRLTNRGDDLFNAVITDTLPAQLTFQSVSVSPAGALTCTGTASITCTAADLIARNATVTVTITATVNSSVADGTTFRNEARLSHAAGAVNARSAFTTVDTPQDIAVSARLSTPNPVRGSTVRYDIDVTNNAPDGEAEDVLLTIDLPAGVTFASIDGPTPWICDEDDGVVECDTDDLQPGESAAFILRVRLDSAASGQQILTAHVTSDQPDPLTSNNTATVRFTLR